MHISLINFTNKSDEEIHSVVRAINRQLREDFTPNWHWTAEVRLEGRTPLQGTSIAELKKLKNDPQDLRGDAIIYLWDKLSDVPNALGYHDDNNKGLPYGFVFTELSAQLNEPWSVTLSHEVLELVGDANVNTLVAGPDPRDANHLVFHWYEMCDAVQAESYEIDGVRVSNFILPLYFTMGEQVGARNDFLNRGPKPLRSFGIKEGGYVGFYDPDAKDHVTVPGDPKGQQRLTMKEAMGRTRRGPLYRELVNGKGGPSPRLLTDRRPGGK